MALENDYIMRIIHEMVRTIVKLLFGQDEEEPETSEDETASGESELGRLISMADDGRICEAENELYELTENADAGDKNKADLDVLKTGLLFYDYLNTFDNATLENADFSREEIRDGIRNILSVFGYGGLVDALSVSTIDGTEDEIQAYLKAAEREYLGTDDDEDASFDGEEDWPDDETIPEA